MAGTRTGEITGLRAWTRKQDPLHKQGQENEPELTRVGAGVIRGAEAKTGAGEGSGDRT
jgi:hypothetical protein